MIGLEYVLKLYGVTQQELADKLGIKQQNIDLWIRDKSRKIPKKWLPKLVEIFNIPAEYFQKELESLDREKIQLMKMYEVNDDKDLGYRTTDKSFITDKNKGNSIQEIFEFNERRNELLFNIQEILDLEVDVNGYEVCLAQTVFKEKNNELDLIQRFIKILKRCNIDQKRMLDDVLISFCIYQGEEFNITKKFEEFKELIRRVVGFDIEIPDYKDKERFKKFIKENMGVEGIIFDFEDEDRNNFLNLISELIKKEEKRMISNKMQYIKT